MTFVWTILLTMAHLATSIFKTVLKICPASVVAYASSYTKPARLKEIGNELEKFTGGSVDLEMDENTGIAVMTLNNPEKLNSITGKMMVDMADKITVLEKWPAGKGLILMGKNGNFCSGGDLTFVRKAMHYGREMAMFQLDTLNRLHNLPLISVACIQGHTLGGGAELSTACDFRVMSPNARLGFIHLKMGLTTAWGATTRLVRHLGRQKTLHLLSSAKVLTAEEARTFQLVDYILQPSSSLDEEFSECKTWLLSNFLKHDADLIQNLKSSVVFCDRNRDSDASFDEEQKIFAKFWGGSAQKAALSANRKHK